MGTMTFNKDAGAQLLSDINQVAPDKENLQAQELLNFIKKLGLVYKNIHVTVKVQSVLLEGEVDKQDQAER